MATTALSFWAPGTTVRFGSLEFIATAEWVLVRVETPASPAASVAIEATAPQQSAATDAPPSCVGERLWRQLGTFLGAASSRDDMRCVAFALANVGTQLAGGQPLPPKLLTEVAPLEVPHNVCDATRAAEISTSENGGKTLANSEFVGVTSYATESIFDLLNSGVEEESDEESGDETRPPPRECNMVLATAAGARSDVGPAAPEPGTPATPAAERAHTAPPVGDDAQARLQARKLELEEARRHIAEEEAAVDRELKLRQQRARSHARQRARRVNRRIVDGDDASRPFPRAGQNVAAAAALLQTLPLQPTPQAQRAQREIAVLLTRAAEQQAESSRRRAAPASLQTYTDRRASSAYVGGPGCASAQQSSRPERPEPRPSVHSRVGAERDARSTLGARQRAREEEDRRRVRHPRRGGRYDDEEDRSLSPDPPGPKVFSSAIRGATFPQRFRPPTTVAKYAGESDPALWLEDYRLACQAGGANNDLAIIRNLPLYLADSARTWLEHLPANQIHSWSDLREIFVGNFQATCPRPGNPWELKSCRQKPNEPLRDYIRRFSRRCNELPHVVDADVVGAFLSGTTCEALIHELGRNCPRTARELLDVATSHASGEEAVGALLHHTTPEKGKGKRSDGGAGEGASGSKPNKKNKSRLSGEPLVAVTGKKGAKRPAKELSNHFEKKWNGPCPNHEFPVRHLMRDCSLMKKFVTQQETEGPSPPECEGATGGGSDAGEEEGGAYPHAEGCLMIFASSEARASRRAAKVERRDVFAAEPATPAFLRWSELPITFDRTDHPSRVPRPGRYPLVVDPIVVKTRLSKVLMDGGSGLNILYAEVLDAMRIDRARIRPDGSPFHGVVPGTQAVPIGRIDLPVTFGTPSNFRTETLTFEVVGFPGIYHAILGRPCYAKFMAVPNYTYLKLKMPGPKGVITVGASFQHAYQCDVDNCDLASATLASTTELAVVREQIVEDAPQTSRKAASFGPAEDTKVVTLDPEGDKGKTVRIGTSLSPK